MANSPAVGVILRGTVNSTHVSDTEPVVVEVNEFETQIRLLTEVLESIAPIIARETGSADSVRKDYQAKIKAASDELINLVKSKKITPHEGAISAHSLRNTILELARKDLTAFGLAFSRSKKPDSGHPFEYYCEKYAQEKFGLRFKELTPAQHETIYRQIVEKAGKDEGALTKKVKIFGMAGRALMIASLAIAVYNVAQAEDKERQLAKEGATFAAGAAGGATAMIVVGLAVSTPVGWVALGLAGFVGAALTGLGAAESFDYFWPEKTRR